MLLGLHSICIHDDKQPFDCCYQVKHNLHKMRHILLIFRLLHLYWVPTGKGLLALMLKNTSLSSLSNDVFKHLSALNAELKVRPVTSHLRSSVSCGRQELLSVLQDLLHAQALTSYTEGKEKRESTRLFY